jgi:hypothetical protein
VTQIHAAPSASSFAETAEAVITSYPSSPAAATERAIAVLALWALDAIEAGRLAPLDADRVFTMLDVEIGDAERKGGPELSDDASQLLLEAMTLDHWGGEFSADPVRMRALAFAILGAAAA